MSAAAHFRVEHVQPAPRGWKTRTIVPGSRSEHEVRIAFPPGRRKKGSSPGELLIFGNPARVASRRSNATPKGHKPGCKCFACKRARTNGPSDKLGKQRAARDRAAEIRRARLARPAFRRRRADRQHPNSSEEQKAVQLYQSFHGRDPKEIVDKHVSAAVRLEYTSLGDLEYVRVITPIGQKAKFGFEGDAVKLASSPDGKQLYAIGGNQNLAACLDKDSLEKDFIDVGEAQEVQYLARKVHGGFRPVSYYHKFGEKNGAKPGLMFDKLKKQIFFVGGEYWIDTSKGVSPGIEN